jgi:hypothetical protein
MGPTGMAWTRRIAKELPLAHQVIDFFEEVGFVVWLSNKAAVIGDLTIARPDLTGRDYEQHPRPPCVHLSRQSGISPSRGRT